MYVILFMFRKRTAYEMRISDWSSDVCSSDLVDALRPVFSENGLIHARVRVEVEWLLALAAEPGIPELAPFPAAAAKRLLALADGFSTADAARAWQSGA